MTSPYRQSFSTQSTDAHHLAALNKQSSLHLGGLQTSQHTSNIRTLLSPPESPDMKTSANYSSPFDSYGVQPRYESERYVPVPQQTRQVYEESCSCCAKPTPVYSPSSYSSSSISYAQPQPQRYAYYPNSITQISPYDCKPTAPSLPRLNTVLESLASQKHFPHKSIVDQLSPTGSSSGNRYQCPYCSKRFSRPSSLRIHTYSHTGEKPFVCTEPGCGRKFSVQSNMRRHLRVHRLGRPVKKTRYDGEVEGYKMLSPAGALRSY
ncbi:10590_t:CDS:1 [Funneliformis mosseae]|uniref:10590_t:CDS:1 n=2 Tax=Funneliformis TaxID=1117308 RepID=A0A9N8VQX2_FUNMO|nr:10590_t:CDS:1 [Funneliformis mosseae]